MTAESTVAEALRVRFADAPPAAAADPAVRALVEGLARFTPGRAPPGPGAIDVEGLAVAPAAVDRALRARVGAAPRPWPGGAPAAVILTHDVDAFDGLSHFPVRLAGWAATTAAALARRDRAAARRTVRRAARWSGWWLRRRDPVADFERWMALEARFGVRSTFFFLALERALSREGRMYRADDPRVRAVLRTLARGGWEIGLHAARYGSDTVDGLVAQRRRLEAAAGGPIRAMRHHYLAGDFPAGWRRMKAAGLEVSSNVGFHPPWQGFRTGTAWPHRPLGADGPWEVPMALMDAAHGPAAARLVPLFDRLLAEAQAVGGALVVNFHTNYRAEVDAPGVHRAYEAILERVRRAVDGKALVALTLGAAVAHVARAAGEVSGPACSAR